MKSCYLYFGCILLTGTAMAAPVTESRTWVESYPVTAGEARLTIRNIWGNVRVRPGKAGAISVSASERRSAPTQALFDRSVEVLRLDVQADEESVSLHVGDRDVRWKHRDPCPGCRAEFQFDVAVPPGTRLDIGTVTDGTIDIADVFGVVSANNVNGPITVGALRECAIVESVNGAVTIDFSSAPGHDCHIETVNGDVALRMPDGTGLDVSLDIFNGDVTTEFSVNPFALPPRVERSVDGGRQRYTIAQAAGIRLGGGGPTFSISSLNGDISIQRSQ